MPPKPRSLLFDEAQRVGQGGCHFTGDELPYSCLAASAGFVPKSGNSQTDPNSVICNRLQQLRKLPPGRAAWVDADLRKFKSLALQGLVDLITLHDKAIERVV